MLLTTTTTTTTTNSLLTYLLTYLLYLLDLNSHAISLLHVDVKTELHSLYLLYYVDEFFLGLSKSLYPRSASFGNCRS